MPRKPKPPIPLPCPRCPYGLVYVDDNGEEVGDCWCKALEKQKKAES